MSVKVFRFTQSTPSTSWVVYHALARTPSFDAILNMDDGSKQSAIPAEVTHTSLNSMTLTWSEPRTGYVTVVAGI